MSWLDRAQARMALSILRTGDPAGIARAVLAHPRAAPLIRRFESLSDAELVEILVRAEASAGPNWQPVLAWLRTHPDDAEDIVGELRRALRRRLPRDPDLVPTVASSTGGL